MPRPMAYVTSVAVMVLTAPAVWFAPSLALPLEASASSNTAALSATVSPAALPADFNGDGFSDLAVGVRNESVGEVFSAGAVNVLYGSASGLVSSGSQFWHQESPGMAGDGAEAEDDFGSQVAAADFNGDGFADLVIGVNRESVGAVAEAGAVNVLYGSASGLVSSGSQFWHQNSPGVSGTAERRDAFGLSVGAGDFNSDGFADLVVGVPFEWVGAVENAGAVNVLYGSSAGLTAAGNQLWHQNSPGVGGTVEELDLFGSSLAAGDFNGNGFSDLAIGVDFEGIRHVEDAGAVNVLYGSSAGLTAAGNQLWHQNSPGVSGTAEEADQFGSSLAAADFGGSSHADLAVGVFHEAVGPIFGAGAVNVLYGSSAGLTAAGNQLWHQNSPGVEGTAEESDEFGSSLAAADFGGCCHPDLAVGVPVETVGSLFAAGAVNVLYGSSAGLTAAGDQLWHQNSSGVEDVAEEFDLFGFALAAADFGGSSQADLAVGVPGESLGDIIEAGAVNVLYGSSGGLTATGDQFWHQDSPGVVGDGAEVQDFFGRSLAPKQ
jgi:disulfide bond formation protein DsbB